MPNVVATRARTHYATYTTGRHGCLSAQLHEKYRADNAWACFLFYCYACAFAPFDTFKTRKSQNIRSNVQNIAFVSSSNSGAYSPPDQSNLAKYLCGAPSPYCSRYSCSDMRPTCPPKKQIKVDARKQNKLQRRSV